MIEVKNLSVQTSKGVILLDHVEFTLKTGICTGLTGASGSGKTTLLKKIAAELKEREDLRVDYMPQNYEDQLDLSMDLLVADWEQIDVTLQYPKSVARAPRG